MLSKERIKSAIQLSATWLTARWMGKIRCRVMDAEIYISDMIH